MKIRPIHERVDAAEVAAQSKDVFECQYCGCREWIVDSTYPTQETPWRRRRICRHCGKDKRNTSEVNVPKGFKVIVVPDTE